MIHEFVGGRVGLAYWVKCSWRCENFVVHYVSGSVSRGRSDCLQNLIAPFPRQALALALVVISGVCSTSSTLFGDGSVYSK